MFGGYQAALADPIAAVSCARVFPGYSVWTRAMCIDFERGGSTDLDLRFDLPAELEAQIRRELETSDRATPTFEYGYHLVDGTRCTVIRNTVAIRPKGYRKATTPPAPERGIVEFRRSSGVQPVEFTVVPAVEGLFREVKMEESR